MNIQEVIEKFKEELKKEPVDRKAIVSCLNEVIISYNENIKILGQIKQTEEKTIAKESELKTIQKDFKKKALDLSTIFEIAKELASSLNIEELLKTILLTSMGHLIIEKGLIFIYSKEKKIFTCGFQKGTKEDYSGVSISEEDVLINMLKEKAKPFSAKEVGDANIRSVDLKKLEIELVVPLIIKGKLPGILLLGSRTGGMPYTEANKEFLSALGSFAAIALENANLYKNLDRKILELSTLYNISKEINASTEQERVLELMIETITTGFYVESCFVLLGDIQKKDFKTVKTCNIDEKLANKIFSDILLPDEKTFIGEVFLINDMPKEFKEKNVELILSVPLMAGNRIIGFVIICKLFEITEVNQEIMQMFAIIASQMAPPLLMTKYLSKDIQYAREPFKSVVDAIEQELVKAQENSVNCSFGILQIDSKSKLTDAQILEVTDKTKSFMQETDYSLRIDFNRLLLIFPATGKNELQNLLTDFARMLSNTYSVISKLVEFPQDGDTAGAIMERLYQTD